MARKTKPENAGSTNVPIMVREIAFMSSGQWSPLDVAAAINNLPSELDRVEPYSNAPCRPISSASPWSYDE
jgi:hypothetical protein